MLKVSLYTNTGTKKSTPVSLPKEFSEKENDALLKQTLRVYINENHKGSSKIKSRSEIKASTKKIWRQKGTGRARHGALSAPVFVGGGVAHGPTGEKRSLSLPKKMKKKALGVALSQKARSGRLVVVSGIEKIQKTKEGKNLIDKVSSKEAGDKKITRATVVLDKENKDNHLYFRNLKNVRAVSVQNLNAYDVFYGGLIIFDKGALQLKK